MAAMAESTAGLAADILAAVTAPVEPGVRADPEPTEDRNNKPIPAQTTHSPPKRSRTPGAVDRAGPEKRRKTEQVDAAMRSLDASAVNWDISTMLQNALGSLDEQSNDVSGMEGEERILPPPAVSPLTPPPVPPERVIQNQIKFSSNPFHVLRTMSLPLLGSLAVQILLALSQQPREETAALLSNSESDFRKAFDRLKSTFTNARALFSDSNFILSAEGLEIKDEEDRETIRIANLATVCASIFGDDNVALEEIHEHAFRIFLSDYGEITEECARIILGLKTQAFLTAVTDIEDAKRREEVLGNYFTTDLEEVLKGRNPFGELLTPVEEGMVKDARSRKELLLESAGDDDQRQLLSEQHPFEDFVDDLGGYLQSHLSTVVDYAERYGINIPSMDDAVSNDPLEDMAHHTENDSLAALLSSNAAGGVTDSLKEPNVGPEFSETNGSLEDVGLGLGKLIQESLSSQKPPQPPDSVPDSAANGPSLFEGKELASLIAESLSAFGEIPNSSVPTAHSASNLTGGPLAALHSPYLSHLNQSPQTAYYPYQHTAVSQPQSSEAPDGNLPPNQSFPTSVLYERARQAAVAKSSAHARREGIHSTRRPWSSEEEKALMAGLDMVKGPHWSQILSLFGPNGTISDILKDRTQVQLKDKARNLKLFFLKTNSEMPYYLQCVTGELKTRAPSQAARKEAEEKARLNSEEEQARLQGIMTLAGGLQNNSGGNVAPLASSSSARASPIAPGVAATATSAARMATPPVVQNATSQAPPLAAAAAVTPQIKAEPQEPRAILPAQPPLLPQQVQQHAAERPAPPRPLQPQPQLQPKGEPDQNPRSQGHPTASGADAVQRQTTTAMTPPPTQRDAHDGVQEAALLQSLKAVMAAPSG